MADRFDLDAIEADDALLDLLAAGGGSAWEAGEHDPALKLLAGLRLAVEVEDELPVETIDDPESFLARCAALNPVTDPFARKVAARGLALGVAAVAALSVSGVAAAVTGDPLSPYEKVIEKVVDGLRPETSFPKEQLDGMPVVDKTKIVKVLKDYRERQAEAKAAAEDRTNPLVIDLPPADVEGVPKPPLARPTPPEVEMPTAVKKEDPVVPPVVEPTQPTDEQTVDQPTGEPTGEPTETTTTPPPTEPTDSTTPTPTPTDTTTDPATTDPATNGGSTDTGNGSTGNPSSGETPGGSQKTVPQESTGEGTGTGTQADTQTGTAEQDTAETTPADQPAEKPVVQPVEKAVVEPVEKAVEKAVLPTPTDAPVELTSRVEEYLGKGHESDAKHASAQAAVGYVKEQYAKGKHSSGQYAEGKHAAIDRAHGSVAPVTLRQILTVLNTPMSAQ